MVVSSGLDAVGNTRASACSGLRPAARRPDSRFAPRWDAVPVLHEGSSQVSGEGAGNDTRRRVWSPLG